MPLPVLAVAAIAALLGAGVVGIVVICWDDIVLALAGKTLAVLGPRAVGKTTFIKFLTEGEISEKYEATLGAVKTEGRRFSLKDLKLNVRDGRDVGGGEERPRRLEATVMGCLSRNEKATIHQSHCCTRLAKSAPRPGIERVKGFPSSLCEHPRSEFMGRMLSPRSRVRKS